MVGSAFIHLGLLSLVCKTAFTAPARVALIDPRHEDFPTTSAREKRFYDPIRPFPAGPLPLPHDYLPGNIEPSHSIKPTLIPLAPGPVLPNYVGVAVPMNPTLDIELKDTDPIERRYVVGDTDHDPSTDQSVPTKGNGLINSLPLTVDSSLPMDVLPIDGLPPSGRNKDWQSSTTILDDSIKADPSRDVSTLPDSVNHVTTTHVPTGDIFRREDSDSTSLRADRDRKRHPSTDEGDEGSLDRASFTHDFNALVEEIHHPAHSIYHRQFSGSQVVPSTIKPNEDDTAILESDEVLKQSLISPGEVHADYVVIHQPKHDIFRRWRKTQDVYQDSAPEFTEIQDLTQFDTKLVVHRPANNIFRRGKSTGSAAGADRSSTLTHQDSHDRADIESSNTVSAADVVTHHPAGEIYRRRAHTSPTRKFDDEESEFELIHHLGHGPVVLPRPGTTEHSFDESVGFESRKRNAQPIPPPDYFEVGDRYNDSPHTIPRPRPIPLPVLEITSRQSATDGTEDGEDNAEFDPRISNGEGSPHNPAALHWNKNTVHRRGPATAGSDGVEAQTQTQNGDSESETRKGTHADRPSHHHLSTHENGDGIRRRQNAAEDVVIPMNAVNDSESLEEDDYLASNSEPFSETKGLMWKRIFRIPAVAHQPVRWVGRRTSEGSTNNNFELEIKRRQSEDQPEEQQYEGQDENQEQYQDQPEQQYQNQEQYQQQEQYQDQDQHQEQDSEPEPELDREQYQEADPKTDNPPSQSNQPLPQLLPAVELKTYNKVFLPVSDKPVHRSEPHFTQTPPSRVWRHARRIEITPVTQVEFVGPEACERNGMSRDEVLKCYREIGLFSLNKDSEVSTEEYEPANAAYTLNSDKETQDITFAKRQIEMPEYQNVSPDIEEDVQNISTDNPIPLTEKPFNPYIANPDYVTASPATGHVQATSVYRRQSLNAIQLIPDVTVHLQIPERKHKHGHDRREIQNTSGGIAKFLVPAAVVHLKIPGKKHDRRDVHTEDHGLPGVAGSQRRETRSSSSDRESDDAHDRRAFGDEAIYLSPDTHVHKRPGNDQGHKKDDTDKKNHSRSVPMPHQIIARRREAAPRPSSTSTAASANNRDGDRATQHMPANYVSGVKPAVYRREAKKDEKKEKENGDRQSSRPNVPIFEPDYHAPADRVHRRQSEIVDPGENAVQHPVEEVVFKRPGGREWVA